ncbi:hypothetical protein HYU14_01540 [Candidatus Woesearchaeota archaeon]|nr:hypothetical protein [Candidatus Woesearchaeota archaeon]
MTQELPKYALRAYGLMYNRYGSQEEFNQDCLNWAVSSAMRKKIFSVLLHAGWIKKKSRMAYACYKPEEIFMSLFDFKVPEVLKNAKKEYCYTKMSAAEIWSDFSYLQRSRERSPYFIEVKEEDIVYWKSFFSKEGIPFFIREGSFIGEFAIIEPLKKLAYTMHDGFPVDDLDTVVRFCQGNPLFEYTLAYVKQKFKLKVKVSNELVQKAREAL